MRTKLAEQLCPSVLKDMNIKDPLLNLTNTFSEVYKSKYLQKSSLSNIVADQ